AAGAGRREAVEGQAEPPARGGEPLVAGLAASRAQHGGRAFDARPVDVAFRADHRLAELPVVADGAADEAARDVEAIHGVPLGTAPAAAAVDTDLEAGPGVDRIVGRSRLVVGRQLGGRRRPSGERPKADARHSNAIQRRALRVQQLNRTVLLNFSQSSVRKAHSSLKYSDRI